MSTPYIFPTENGLRRDNKALDWGRWHVTGDFHFSVQPYSTAQPGGNRSLAPDDPGKSVWITLDGAHMGVGGDDSWTPACCRSGCCSGPAGSTQLSLSLR